MDRPITTEDLLTAVLVSAPQLSPDGRWVIYQQRRTLLADNSYAHDLWLVPADASSPPCQLTAHEPTLDFDVQFRVSWSPDSASIAWFPAGRGATVSRVERGRLTDTRTVIEAQPLVAYQLVSNLRWSPDGRRLAFIAGRAPEPTLDPMTAVRIDVRKGSSIGAQAGTPGAVLCVVDVETGALTELTGSGYDVNTFNWAPDSARIAFTATRDGEPGLGHYLAGDLYVVDVATGVVRTVLAQAGGDAGPVFSPDGTRLAFWSQMGADDWGWSYVVTPAVVDLDGGTVVYPLADWHDEIDTVFYDNDLVWAPEGDALLFSTGYQLTHHLFRIPVAGGKLHRLTPDLDTYYAGFSLSRDGSRAAFLASQLNSPFEVYVSDLEFNRPCRLTDANPWVAHVAPAQVRRLNWPSSDGRWQINGYVLLPPGHRDGDRHPLLVEAIGGPAMVPMRFLNSLPFPNLVFAALGYAVLVPNTRGRSGYGVPFRRAIEAEQSNAVNGLQDLLDGVDHVVELGLADRSRMGIMGHSYGAVLTGLAIVETDRFRAAAFHEGAVELVHHLLKAYGNPCFQAHQRQQGGFNAPYTRTGLATAMRESAIYRISEAVTPVLIEAGELAMHQECAVLANALEYLGVPYEFFIYPRTGHGTTEPVLVADEFRRKLEWFGYWLRDEPLADTDADRQARYDTWKNHSGRSTRPRAADQTDPPSSVKGALRQ